MPNDVTMQSTEAFAPNTARGWRAAPRYLWWAAIAVFTLMIAGVSIQRYLVDPDLAPPPLLANAFAHPFLTVHVVAGVTSLLVGPIQFIRAVRRRAPAVHRAIGYTYVSAVAVSSVAAFLLAIGTTAGPVAGAGFALLALLLALTTGFGVRAAIGRRLTDHRRWMIRSYALTAAAITLRLMLPAAAMLRFDMGLAYTVIAWTSWIVNLAIAEAVIRSGREVETFG